MKTLVALYMIYLSWGTAGQGRVSILELSRYMRVSKSHMRKELFRMADDGLVEIIRLFTDAGSEKLVAQLSDAGDEYLMNNFETAVNAYHIHVAETIEIIKRKAAGERFAPKKLTKKQREAIEAGQKELF